MCEAPEWNTRKCKRDLFLARLASTGKNPYKRYTRSPLRYAGGKSLAVGIIIESIPDNIETVVSPFMGGGSVEIALARELDIPVIAYDIFTILCRYWQVHIDKPERLADTLMQWQPTQDTYKEVKDRLKSHWQGECKIEDKTLLAAHYWYNHNLSYGPGFLGWMSKIYECPDRYKRLVDKVRHFDAKNLRVRQGSFEKSLPRHKGDFLYCDPPYYLQGNSKMFRGIYPQRNFPIYHDGFDHQALRDILLDHEGGFLMSYNDCDVIREWYSSCDIRRVEWRYTMGQGETRIGKNRIDNGTYDNVKDSHEILISKKPKKPNSPEKGMSSEQASLVAH
ncbi:MAG: DNA adenine methylase [Ectothiorhodospiraceae bacterium AqS1]|nr:DNA adenine methylase [Ectothiorhodospiraceae bacterium AqS1]